MTGQHQKESKLSSRSTKCPNAGTASGVRGDSSTGSARHDFDRTVSRKSKQSLQNSQQHGRGNKTRTDEPHKIITKDFSPLSVVSNRIIHLKAPHFGLASILWFILFCIGQNFRYQYESLGSRIVPNRLQSHSYELDKNVNNPDKSNVSICGDNKMKEPELEREQHELAYLPTAQEFLTSTVTRMLQKQNMLLRQRQAANLVYSSMMIVDDAPSRVAVVFEIDDDFRFRAPSDGDWAPSFQQLQKQEDICAVLSQLEHFQTVTDLTLIAVEFGIGNKHRAPETAAAVGNIAVFFQSICGLNQIESDNLQYHAEYMYMDDDDSVVGTWKSSNSTLLSDVVLWLDPLSANNVVLVSNWQQAKSSRGDSNVTATINGLSKLRSSRITAMAAHLSGSFTTPDGVLSLPLGAIPLSVNRHCAHLVDLQEQLINAVGNRGGGDDSGNDAVNFVESHIVEMNLSEHLQQNDEEANDLVFSPTAMTTKHQYHEQKAVVIFCKSPSCRNLRMAEPAYLEVVMRQRLKHKHITNNKNRGYPVTLSRQSKPSKVWESLYCNDDAHKAQCAFLNGFDPSIPNVNKSQLEVKISSLGSNVGRGLFTKVDISAGSFMLLEQMASYVIFKPYMMEHIELTNDLLGLDFYGIDEEEEEEKDDTKSKNGAENSPSENADFRLSLNKKREILSISSYAEGYGFAVDTYGDGGVVVDSGYAMFSNHGCNNSHHVGDLNHFYENVSYPFYLTDIQRKNSNEGVRLETLAVGSLPNDDGANVQPDHQKKTQEISYSEITLFFSTSNPDGSLFNPLLDRRIERDLVSDGMVRTAEAGEEIFCDYTSYAGFDPEDWADNERHLQAQCNGEEVGIVVEIDTSTSK